MNHGAFRRLLDLILGRVARRLDDATRVARKARGGAPEGLSDAILGIVEEGRRQAWAVTVAYMRSQARDLGAEEAFIPSTPPYSVNAIRETERRFSDPYGRDWDRMRASMQRHVIAASRQTVVQAVEEAPEWVDLLDDLEDLEDDLDGFPEEQKREAIKEIKEKATKKTKPPAKTIKGLFDDIYERLDEAAKELDEPELGEQGKAAQKAVERDSSDYRRDLQGRLIARPFAWARVVRPSENGPCGFCAMLASRGPVYRSSKAAGLGVDKYHDGCRCEIVAVWTSRAWPGKEESEEYARIYNRVVREGGLHGAQARTGMDNALRGNRSSEKSKKRRKDD